MSASCEKLPSNMPKMNRFRSSCACAKYHLDLCFQFIHSIVSNDSVTGQRSPDQANRRHVFAWRGEGLSLGFLLVVVLHDEYLLCVRLKAISLTVA